MRLLLQDTAESAVALALPDVLAALHAASLARAMWACDTQALAALSDRVFTRATEMLLAGVATAACDDLHGGTVSSSVLCFVGLTASKS